MHEIIFQRECFINIFGLTFDFSPKPYLIDEVKTKSPLYLET